MPKFKISQEPFPMVIEAPDQDAAREGYEAELERRGTRGLKVIDISDGPVDLVVDETGYRVEED